MRARHRSSREGKTAPPTPLPPSDRSARGEPLSPPAPEEVRRREHRRDPETRPAAGCASSQPLRGPGQRAWTTPPGRGSVLAPARRRAAKPPFARTGSCPHPGAAVRTRAPVSRAGLPPSTRALPVLGRQGAGPRRRARSPPPAWRHLDGRVPLGPRPLQGIPDVPTRVLSPLSPTGVTCPCRRPRRSRTVLRRCACRRVGPAQLSLFHARVRPSRLTIGRSTDGTVKGVEEVPPRTSSWAHATELNRLRSAD